MIEFALALPIVLMISLVMVQSSLLMGGNICVHYSAYCAARSAIVQIPDDGSVVEPPNVLGSGKGRQIYAAAVWAVMPISCGSQQIDEADADTLIDGLERFFDNYDTPTPWWVDSYIARKLQYALDHTEVEVSPPARRGYYAPDEDIRVQVRHTFYLSVPYAGKLFATFDDDGRELDFGAGEYGIVIRAACTLTNEGVVDFVAEEMIDPTP